MAAFTRTTPNYKNIILDMDGTILDNIPLSRFKQTIYHNVFLPQPIERPCLKQFMIYVFNKFERVSIWTAGTKEWFELCYNKVLKKYIPEGKRFDFVLTREHFTLLFPLKPLSFVYKKYILYNNTNTLIVDDNPITYSQNIENAIGIKPFFYDLLSQKQREIDCELLKLIDVLERKLNNESVSTKLFLRIVSEPETRPYLLCEQDKEPEPEPEPEPEIDEKIELHAQLDYDVITGDYGDLYD